MHQCEISREDDAVYGSRRKRSLWETRMCGGDDSTDDGLNEQLSPRREWSAEGKGNAGDVEARDVRPNGEYDIAIEGKGRN